MRAQMPFDMLKNKKSFDTLFNASLLVFICLFINAVFSAWQFTTDDAYITARYAYNWYQFDQLTWNIDSAPVEGYSNTLYLLLGYLALALAISPITVFKAFSLASLLITLGIIYVYLRHQTNRWVAIATLMLFASYKGVVWWSVSGLETAFFILVTLSGLLLFLSYLSNDKASPKILSICSVLVFIAGLTRPEGPFLGIVFSLVLIVYRLVEKKRDKILFNEVMYLAVPFVLLYGVYFAMRYAHFGEIFPNTYYCKTGYAGDPLKLIKHFWELAWPLILIGVLGFLLRLKHADRPEVLSLVTFLVYIMGATTLLYGVHPVIAYYNRHALVIFVVACMLFAMGVHKIYVWKPMPVLSFLLILVFYSGAQWLVEAKRFEGESSLYAARMNARQNISEYLNGIGIENYAVGDAGIIPYATPGTTVFDYYCLNSREYSSFPQSTRRENYIEWLVEQKPDAVLVVSKKMDKIIPRNTTQRQLVEAFSKVGYIDLNVVFGANADSFQYRILALPAVGASHVD